ncbi:uncharacterized protein MONBRDRAFT_6462 [Monosiga brevicollis MX1]|uniref:MYND-type domain-containing protein n=1 Tax=Monosiga brevicollis TaxID=81824 RepID=A9UTY3_MONBE|nr:uncharacterized protein MONBRDRAFT_6462 [Monosiga brevicollis MX1]EDQ91326.1 predicted protein [Monosiga brevicollis MX1]|eukprot:XP_001743748.1 hypothetical protein [Monosiga brevicollis MX1]
MQQSVRAGVAQRIQTMLRRKAKKILSRCRLPGDARTCGQCGRTGTMMVCSWCRLAYFCSKACQREAFAHHRFMCEQVGAIKAAIKTLVLRTSPYAARRSAAQRILANYQIARRCDAIKAISATLLGHVTCQKGFTAPPLYTNEDGKDLVYPRPESADERAPFFTGDAASSLPDFLVEDYNLELSVLRALLVKDPWVELGPGEVLAVDVETVEELLASRGALALITYIYFLPVSDADLMAVLQCFESIVVVERLAQRMLKDSSVCCISCSCGGVCPLAAPALVLDLALLNSQVPRLCTYAITSSATVAMRTRFLRAVVDVVDVMFVVHAAQVGIPGSVEFLTILCQLSVIEANLFTAEGDILGVADVLLQLLTRQHRTLWAAALNALSFLVRETDFTARGLVPILQADGCESFTQSLRLLATRESNTRNTTHTTCNVLNLTVVYRACLHDPGLQKLLFPAGSANAQPSEAAQCIWEGIKLCRIRQSEDASGQTKTLLDELAPVIRDLLEVLEAMDGISPDTARASATRRIRSFAAGYPGLMAGAAAAAPPDTTPPPAFQLDADTQPPGLSSLVAAPAASSSSKPAGAEKSRSRSLLARASEAASIRAWNRPFCSSLMDYHVVASLQHGHLSPALPLMSNVALSVDVRQLPTSKEDTPTTPAPAMQRQLDNLVARFLAHVKAASTAQPSLADGLLEQLFQCPPPKQEPSESVLFHMSFGFAVDEGPTAERIQLKLRVQVTPSGDLPVMATKGTFEAPQRYAADLQLGQIVDSLADALTELLQSSFGAVSISNLGPEARVAWLLATGATWLAANLLHRCLVALNVEMAGVQVRRALRESTVQQLATLQPFLQVLQLASQYRDGVVHPRFKRFLNLLRTQAHPDFARVLLEDMMPSRIKPMTLSSAAQPPSMPRTAVPTASTASLGIDTTASTAAIPPAASILASGGSIPDRSGHATPAPSGGSRADQLAGKAMIAASQQDNAGDAMWDKMVATLNERLRSYAAAPSGPTMSTAAGIGPEAEAQLDAGDRHVASPMAEMPMRSVKAKNTDRPGTHFPGPAVSRRADPHLDSRAEARSNDVVPPPTAASASAAASEQASASNSMTGMALNNPMDLQDLAALQLADFDQELYDVLGRAFQGHHRKTVETIIANRFAKEAIDGVFSNFDDYSAEERPEADLNAMAERVIRSWVDDKLDSAVTRVLQGVLSDLELDGLLQKAEHNLLSHTAASGTAGSGMATTAAQEGSDLPHGVSAQARELVRALSSDSLEAAAANTAAGEAVSESMDWDANSWIDVVNFERLRAQLEAKFDAMTPEQKAQLESIVKEAYERTAEFDGSSSSLLAAASRQPGPSSGPEVPNSPNDLSDSHSLDEEDEPIQPIDFRTLDRSLFTEHDALRVLRGLDGQRTPPLTKAS